VISGGAARWLRPATQSVAAVRSHAERGNEGINTKIRVDTDFAKAAWEFTCILPNMPDDETHFS
jgi:hypothetical protein